MGISTELTKFVSQSIENDLNNINFFREQIILADGEKELFDSAIYNLDIELLNEVDILNGYLVGIQSAYQERINVGCRTDIFWRVTGIDTTTSPPQYDITATKISIGGYPPDPNGIGTVGVGTTGLAIFSYSGITTLSEDSLYGFDTDNLWGIKYYNEPYINDIGDTTVATFIGTVGIGQTTLIVMIPNDSGISNSFKAGQLVTSNKSGVFGGASNTIVGIGTTNTNLTSVGIASTNVTVPTILLETATIGIASAPEADGSFVNFTVLTDPDSITSIREYAVGFTDSPFSPQTIGIMERTQLGIGKSVYVDNSGISSASQSWKPENEVSGVEDVDDVTEPSVGAGKIYYRVGFTSAPSSGGSPAVEGTTIIGVTDADSILYFTNLSSCSTEEAALTAAINTKNAAEAAFNAGIGTFNLLLEGDRAIREERDLLNLKIWGLRQSIGQVADDIDRLNALATYIGISTISDVLG